jgi:hypothetical protein
MPIFDIFFGWQQLMLQPNSLLVSRSFVKGFLLFVGLGIYF